MQPSRSNSRVKRLSWTFHGPCWRAGRLVGRVCSPPARPTALKEQLAIGGRLVIPVGEEERQQTLIKLTRKSEPEFEQENLGAVAFVPLIGEQGWRINDSGY